ncbi:MAG TPA: methyltransferase domain-containing protein [Thermoplasmata archaeon]|nr:methyltransferase domain-containing protein [Thermoplasmata archaeon]
MRPGALEAVACPECDGPLTASGTGELTTGSLRCDRDRLEFEVRDGVPELVRPSRIAGVRSFATGYSAAWRKDGWGASDPTTLLALPYRDTTRLQSSKWRVKARSADALFAALLPRTHPRVADLGCGVGWLSHRLARRGHEVFAVDVITDGILGLAAANVYVRQGPFFERVLGELDRPPFREGILDAVVCNASLHYAEDVESALRGIARTLRPGGALFVLNSPVHEDARSAIRAESGFRSHLLQLGAPEPVAFAYHHFTREPFLRLLEGTVGPAKEVPFDPGIGFRLARKAKGVALRMELASFPILVATRAAG